MGVVGVLQFEVLEYRLKNEYGVEVRREGLPYQYLRWIENQDIDVKALDLTSDTRRVQDLRGRPLLLFTSSWALIGLWIITKTCSSVNLARVCDWPAQLINPVPPWRPGNMAAILLCKNRWNSVLRLALSYLPQFDLSFHKGFIFYELELYRNFSFVKHNAGKILLK